jgi:hypothetical protein
MCTLAQRNKTNMKRILIGILALAAIVCLAQTGFREPAFVGGLNRVASSSTPSTLNTGLIAYWTFDSANKYTNDVSGNNNWLIPVNTPTYDSVGIISDCFVTNATPNGYLKIASNNFTATTFSVSLWLKRTTTVTGNAICGQYGSALELKRKWSIYDMSSDRLQFIWSNNGTNITIVTTATGTFTSNTWYNIVFTADETSAIGYINGASIFTNTTSLPIFSAQGDYYIGRTVQNTTYFLGYIDEFGHWSKKITPTEVSTLYNGGSPVACPWTGKP